MNLLAIVGKNAFSFMREAAADEPGLGSTTDVALRCIQVVTFQAGIGLGSNSCIRLVQ
jgi:hypothetical protein